MNKKIDIRFNNASPRQGVLNNLRLYIRGKKEVEIGMEFGGESRECMTQLDSNTDIHQNRVAQSIRATKWQFYWLCGLILSFAYERPLAYLTPYDRTNPRLFDLLVLIGILTILPRLRYRSTLPKSFNIWAILVTWFCFCAVLWTSGFLPWEYGKFSLFRAAKYVEGLIAIYIAMCIPLDLRRKRTLQNMMVAGGIFIAIYCIPEYFLGSSEVVVREDLTVNIGVGNLVGPFGASYFQLAQTSALLSITAISFFLTSNTMFKRFLGFLIAVFIAWPLFACGSRTGLSLLTLSLFFLIVMEKRIRRRLLIYVVAIVPLIFVFDKGIFLDTVKSGHTIQRMQAQESGANSLQNRIELILNFPFSSYKAGYLLPIIGGGFNVAPRSTNFGNYYYRVDYGIHSIYLYVFEQAGVIGLVLFFLFIVVTIRELIKTILKKESFKSDFSKVSLSYFLATLIVGIGGHNFWQGFDSGNFNTLLMINLFIGLMPSVETNHSIKPKTSDDSVVTANK